MKRTVASILATIIGLVLLLQFKVHSTQATTGGLATITPRSVSTSGASSSRHPKHPTRKTSSPGGQATSPSSPSRTPVASHSSQPSAPTTATTRSIIGQAVQTMYGQVQVKIVLTGSRLTSITPLQLPNNDPRSVQIAAGAVPILRSEALKANSARIDVVSGATYTSNGYAQSLQSALDNA
jgi:uncharacterized protein with FMN-binding domain